MNGAVVMSRQPVARPARVVIVGGGYAGLLAALRLARKARRRRIPVEVTLVNGSSDFAERIRLHEILNGSPPARLALPRLFAGTGVTLCVGWARSIDPEARTVQVDPGGTHPTRTLAYDALLYAPGSLSDPEIVPGGREHAFALNDFAGMQALRRRLAGAQPGGRVVVVGGGLTGIEAAAEIAEAFPDLRVTLATRGDVGEGFSAAGRAYLEQALCELGVTVRRGARALEVRDDGVLVAAEGAAPELLPAAAVVLTAGLRASGLAAASGLPVTADGRLVVDACLRSPAYPSIRGAGDAAAALDPEGRPLRMCCAAAMPQGAYVADAILADFAGEPARPFGLAFAGKCVSLGRRRGLVQRVDALDRPLEHVVTGRLGAWLKELVCRYTVLALRAERLLPGAYRWPREHRPEASRAPHADLGAEPVR